MVSDPVVGEASTGLPHRDAGNPVASPQGRGLFAIAGRTAERRKERWYARILKALISIKNKPQGAAVGGRGGDTSLSLGLLGQGKGLLGSIGKGAGGLLKKGGGLFKGAAGGGLLKGAGGLLKRIPLLGALMAGGGVLSSLFGGDDPEKSAEENRTGRYKGAGSAAGAGIGGAVGAVLGSALGPVGTIGGGILGSMAGDLIGEKVGEWTKTLVDSDIPKKIGKTWDAFVKILKDSAFQAWDFVVSGATAAFDFLKQIPEKISAFFEGLDQAIRKIPVIGAAYAAAVDAGKKVVETGKAAVADFQGGMKEKTDPVKRAPAGQVLDASGRDWNDPRRLDAAEAVNSDGRMMNDPRRLDAEPVAQTVPDLPPATSVAQSAGRAVGSVVNATGVASGAAREVVQGAAAIGEQAAAGYAERRGLPTTAPAPVGALQKGGRGAGRMAGAALSRWNGGARNDLTNAAVDAGVDPGLVAQIGHFESGFNPSATPTRRDGSKISSAHGYGQFLDGTWTGVLNKHGAKYGVKDAGKLTDQQARAYRNDPKIQAAMLAEFTKENVGKGRALGGTDDAANVYAYHNLGDGDARRMLKGMKSDPAMTVRDALIGGRGVSAKESARIERVISGNKSLYGDGSITATQAYQNMGSKMREGSGYAADARQLAATKAGTEVLPIAQTASPLPAKQAAAVNLVNSVQRGSVSSSMHSANTVTAGLKPVVQVSIPPSTPVKLPPAPEVSMPEPALNSTRQGAVQVSMREPIGQNVGDRSIAHIATGSMGMA